MKVTVYQLGQLLGIEKQIHLFQSKIVSCFQMELAAVVLTKDSFQLMNRMLKKGKGELKG